MKKVLFASLALATACSAAYGQAQRRVLVEGFTQASCPPCAAYNPGYNALVSQPANVPKVVTIRYQTSWPGTDPMNAQNPTEVATRVTYYNVQGVPDMQVDGNAPQNINTGDFTQAILDAEYAVTSPVKIEVNHDWTSDAADSLDIWVKIINVSASDYGTANHRVHVVLTEDEVQFATPPGTNGEKVFHNVMRKMVTTADGATFTMIPAGDTLDLSYRVKVPTYVYAKGQLAVTAFTQDNATKHVDQAEISLPKPMPVGPTVYLDMEAVGQTAVPADYCAYDVTPTVEVFNNEADPLTSFRVSYTINGGAPVMQDITGVSLANGTSTVVAFPTITFNPGAATLAYTVNNLNGGVGTDVIPWNNLVPSQSFVFLDPTPAGSDLMESFVGVSIGAGAPPSAILASDGTDLGGVIGVGNGDNRSYKWDCYNIQTGYANLIFHKIDMSNVAMATLTFDHAHALYSAAYADRLEVNVSTDCGANWTNVFDKAGSDLATAATTTNDYTSPAAGDWMTNTIDLAAYAGMSELVVAFKGTTDYGNNIFVDNINIATTLVGTKEIAAATSSLTVFPNPVRNEMTVQFDVTETTELNIVVYNALGQQVRNVASGSFNGLNQVTVNTSDFAAGVYHLNLVSNNGVSTQRFVVEK